MTVPSVFPPSVPNHVTLTKLCEYHATGINRNSVLLFFYLSVFNYKNIVETQTDWGGGGGGGGPHEGF